jgi:hypothetical protein
MSIDTGQTFTLINSFYYTSFGNLYYYLYGLMNPTLGTRTISVSIPAFGGYSVGGSSIAYSGVSGFAASNCSFNGNATYHALGLPAFPGSVAVQQITSGWTSTNQTSRQNAGGAGWQESTFNTSTSATVKGANAALGTTVTIPTHAVGDLLVIFAYRNGVATAPTAPTYSGGSTPYWIPLQSGGGNSNASGVWYTPASTSSHTSGTWTNASGLIAVVIQGANTNKEVFPIGGFAQSYSNTTGSSTAPAISQSVTNGSSCLLYFHGHRSNVTTFGAAPTGFTRQVAAVGSSGICLNTKDDTTSNGAANQTDDGNGGSIGQTVEILGNNGINRWFSTGYTALTTASSVGVVLKGQVTPTATPTFVNTAAGSLVTGSGTLTSTWNHTIAAGTNCLLVGVFSNDLVTTPTALSIDSGGPFTVLDHIYYTSFGAVHYTLYGLLNPPVGTRTITTTAFAYGIQGVSAAYSGVSGFAATATAATGGGTNISFGLPAAPGNLAVAFTSSNWSSLTQTSRSNPATGHGWQESTVNTGDSRNFSTTWASKSAYGAVAVVLK